MAGCFSTPGRCEQQENYAFLTTLTRSSDEYEAGKSHISNLSKSVICESAAVVSEDLFNGA